MRADVVGRAEGVGVGVQDSSPLRWRPGCGWDGWVDWAAGVLEGPLGMTRGGGGGADVVSGQLSDAPGAVGTY